MRCLGRAILLLLVLMGLLVAAWMNRDRIQQAWRDVQPTAGEVEAPATPELADAAEEKLARLRGGEQGEIALSGVELESLLRYRYAGALPGFIDSTRVRLAGDRLRVRARVPAERLPALDALGAVADFLPDTASVEIEGRLFSLDDRHAALAIDGVQIADIPIPRRLVPGLLDRLGRSPAAGLPADALAVPLPRGVAAAYVRGDSLVLVSRSARRNN